VSGPRPRWIGAVEPALAFAAITVGYAPMARWWWDRVRAADGLYGHAPLVLAVSAALVARSAWRGPAAVPAAGGALLGLAGVAGALLLQIAALALRVDSLSAFSLWLLLPCLFCVYGGTALVRRHRFALAFLFFAVPLPMIATAHAAHALKAWVSLAARGVLRWFAAGVEVEGSFLLLPGGGRLLVDDECSGLRSLLALLALGALVAAGARLGSGARWLVFALALPIALLANLARVVALSLAGLGGGVAAAARWHDLSGWAVYAVAFALLCGAARGLRREEAAAEAAR